MSLSDSSSEDKESQSSGIGAPLVLFILNIVITESASRGQFQLLGLGDRWDFHYFMMWVSASLLIALAITLWLGCVTVVSENNFCAKLTGLVGTFTAIGWLVAFISTYVKMGEIWDKDPEHTIFFYNPFWTKGITDMNAYHQVHQVHQVQPTNPTNMTTSNTTRLLRGASIEITRRLSDNSVLASEWVYVMSDVVTRIYGFSLMFLPVLLGVVACCAGSGGLCGKLFGSK